MVAIQNIFESANEENGGIAILSDTFIDLRDRSNELGELFKPLTNVGLNDFVWKGHGSNAFFVAPADNDKIVFRVSSEDEDRANDIPFFLASPYEHSVGRFKVEMLLTGKQLQPTPENDWSLEKISEADKAFLLKEMKLADWRTDSIKHLDAPNQRGLFWRDVVVISLRDKEGRIKNIPIVSDPSAGKNYLRNAMPSADRRNVCSANYPTLQDQAEAYNAVIKSDPRLQKLIPQPVQFPETEVIAPLSQSLSQAL